MMFRDIARSTRLCARQQPAQGIPPVNNKRFR